MKKILIISSFLLVIISISLVGYSIVSANVVVDTKKDIISYQANKEKYINPYGYTFDEPNIIVNPYGISPLTALILFETEEEEEITIKIEGVDDNSTYQNTFKPTKRHYIPVYGLYPNKTNNITIQYKDKIKTIQIETPPLPDELLTIELLDNNTNNLIFITNETYPYAVDNNNEIRWYLTKKYTGKLDYLENGHFLLSDEYLYNNNSYNLLEIDLLGKIHKQYIFDAPYQGTYEETDTSLIIDTTPPIEIDKHTGTILNAINQKEKTIEVFLENKKQLPLYINSSNYQISPSIKYNLTKETKQSNKNIFLVGYIEPDETYQNYNIEIIKTNDNLQIIGNFTNNDKVYLILDKFLDKRVYDINNNHTIINKHNLSGKYSIYLSINNTIYKTNNYIKF